MNLYRHILLTTDLTEQSKKTALKALQVAEQYGARLTILHVVEPLPPYALGYMGSVKLEEELLAYATTNLTQLAKELVVPPSDQRIAVGSVKSNILIVAKELDVDLIIMGSHGRHGLDKLIGSTAAAILHGAECDVLVVRIPD